MRSLASVGVLTHASYESPCTRAWRKVDWAHLVLNSGWLAEGVGVPTNQWQARVADDWKVGLNQVLSLVALRRNQSELRRVLYLQYGKETLFIY